MGWFSGDEIVANNAAPNPVPMALDKSASVEQIITAVAVVIVACVVTIYIIAKFCNKILNHRMSSAARREFELNRLNNGARNVWSTLCYVLQYKHSAIVLSMDKSENHEWKTRE